MNGRQLTNSILSYHLPGVLLLTGLHASLLCACSARDGVDMASDREGPLRSTAQKVVVGEDDRLDVYEHPDSSWRAIAEQSTLALISKSTLDTSDPDDIQINASPTSNLCEDERFFGQVAAAGCSGTLIADDLVLTAGHCVGESTCDDTAFVFNFRQQSASALATITSDDVYECSEVLVRRDIANDAIDPLDHAIIRLDRAATPEHTPVQVKTAVEAVALGAELTLIGHTAGLPNKIVPGGEVVNQVADFAALGTTLDSQGGSSGAGVFDASQRQVAIHTHGVGQPGLVEEDGCLVWNAISEGADGTGVRYAFFPILELCSMLDHPLCGAQNPTCGDGLCEPREDFASCAADCPQLPELPWEQLEAVVTTNADWPGGYCAQVDLENTSSAARAWRVRVDLGQSSVTDVWQADDEVIGSILQLTPPSYQSTLGAGATTNAGFCAQKTGPNWQPEIQFAALE